jgi:hypothetical protein
MNMKDYLNSLSENEKAELKKALLVPKDEPDVPDDGEPEPKPFVTEDFTVKYRKRKSKKGKSEVQAGKNEWIDEGELRDVTTPDFEKTPRRRSPPKKVHVECHLCGKTFKSDPRYSYGEFYRCNKCIGR